jgi:integrase
VPYRNGNRKTWTVTLPMRNGSRKRISTGTTHRPTAYRFERMIRDLGPSGARCWDLFDRVESGTLTIGALFDAWSANALDDLRNTLNDVNIEPFVDSFLERHRDHVSSGTVGSYEQKLRQLIPRGVPFPRSSFTVRRLDTFITSYKGASPTKRKVHAALSQFARHLVRHGVLSHNPVREIEAPPSNPPRTSYLEIVDLIKLVEDQREPFRTFAALLAGSAIDLSTALRLPRRDLDESAREFRASGTKSYNRDRVVRVSEWAWPYIARHVQTLKHDALLFPTISADTARDSHDAACARLGIVDYTQRDHRHSYAVRALKVGTPAELVARQLGHANPVMVTKVYGRFIPERGERDRWERAASIEDAKAIEAERARVNTSDAQSRACSADYPCEGSSLNVLGSEVDTPQQSASATEQSHFDDSNRSRRSAYRSCL